MADPGPSESMPAATVPTVLVLGGSGFIGQALVRRLHRSGLRTRVLVRRTSESAALLAEQGSEIVVGDLTDPGLLDAALTGISYVYHLARATGAGVEVVPIDSGSEVGLESYAALIDRLLGALLAGEARDAGDDE